MGSRMLSHQLSNGLYVSGRPEQPKERPPTMSSTAMPYTGGDIKRSGELGKMFDISMEGSKSTKSGPLNNSSRTASSASISSTTSLKKNCSGPLNKHGEPMKKLSGPQPGRPTSLSRQNSGPQPPVLPTTGLITSGPISSGPLNHAGVPRKVSGPLDFSGPLKPPGTHAPNSHAVTRLSHDDDRSFRKSFPGPVLWFVVLLFLMGLIAGGFILGAVHNPVLLIVIVILVAAVAVVFTWNTCYGRKAVIDFISRYPDSDLRNAQDGQLVKVSGIVTCGNTPLESSFQRISRCIYTSTGLYEYRGWNSWFSNIGHIPFTWGLLSLERHVVDFYISDFQSGLRALVKAGNCARVTPFVDKSIVIDIDGAGKAVSPELDKWLHERNLPVDNRAIRLKEGYIREGSTVSLMGVVQRNDNVLMMVPPSESFSTGCQWLKCIFPASLEGIILHCNDGPNTDAVPV